MNKNIYPCLWFDGNAPEAARFYCSVFNNTKITAENPLVTMLELSGQKLMLLNGGPHFTINPSISFFVVCETEEEIDITWKGLLDGGSVMMELDKYPWSTKYGWIKDKYGVSWQIVPTILEELMSDPERSQRVVNAFMKMKKFDIEALIKA